MNWVLAAALICGFSMDLTSCSNNSDNPVPAKKKYRLIQRLEITNDGDTIITDYGYDTQGRLETYVRVTFKPSETRVNANFTFTYGDHCIIERQLDNEYFYYTLNDDGLIIKEENRTEIDKPSASLHTYQYADGRLIAYQESDNPVVSKLHWEDGDLMYYGREGLAGYVDKTEYTRTQLSVDHGFMTEPLGTMSDVLYMMGYYGKPSKHLESHYKKEVQNQLGLSTLIEFDYTYTLADGHIVKMVKESTIKMQVPLINKTSILTATFAYEEY